MRIIKAKKGDTIHIANYNGDQYVSTGSAGINGATPNDPDLSGQGFTLNGNEITVDAVLSIELAHDVDIRVSGGNNGLFDSNMTLWVQTD